MRKIVFLLVLVCLTASSSYGAGLTDGLVAYWPFDGNANDMAGSKNCTLPGPPVVSQESGSMTCSIRSTNGQTG